MIDRARPADRIAIAFQCWKVATHLVVAGCHTLVAFQQLAVDGDAFVDCSWLHDGCAHHKSDIAAAIDRDDRLRCYCSEIYLGGQPKTKKSGQPKATAHFC